MIHRWPRRSPSSPRQHDLVERLTGWPWEMLFSGWATTETQSRPIGGSRRLLRKTSRLVLRWLFASTEPAEWRKRMSTIGDVSNFPTCPAQRSRRNLSRSMASAAICSGSRTRPLRRVSFGRMRVFRRPSISSPESCCLPAVPGRHSRSSIAASIASRLRSNGTVSAAGSWMLSTDPPTPSPRGRWRSGRPICWRSTSAPTTSGRSPPGMESNGCWRAMGPRRVGRVASNSASGSTRWTRPSVA